MKSKLNIPKVKDIMTTKIFYLSPSDSVVTAIELFQKHQSSSAPVINEKKQVIGYLSDTDCIKCIGNCLFHGEIRNNTLDNIMSTCVKTIEQNLDIFELENIFTEVHLRHAPVVDEEKNLVGVVSRRDVLEALSKLVREALPAERVKDIRDLTIHERMQIVIDMID
ncbi:MAG: CBS domain-containing protein [Oligoflexus sp.]